MDEPADALTRLRRDLLPEGGRSAGRGPDAAVLPSEAFAKAAPIPGAAPAGPSARPPTQGSAAAPRAARAASPPLMAVRDLSVDFDGDAGVVHAVRGVSFDIPRGRTLAVVGESGSGKSVSAQAMMGLLPKRGRVVGGSILFDAGNGAVVDIATLPRTGERMRRLRGGRMAMIFQEPMTSLSPLHTIGDQIGEALKLHERVTEEEARARVVAMLARVGFRDPEASLRSYPFELSGGLRQRAMIAMALIANPALLIADEPTTALDVTTQAQILDLMRDLQAERDMSLLLITHDLGVVANMADEVAVMYRGAMMERGPVEAIFRESRHPYLQALMRAVPRFGLGPDERLTPIRPIAAGGVEVISKVARPRAPARPKAAEGAGAGKGSEACDAVLAVRDVSKSFVTRAGLFGGHQGVVNALTRVSLTVPRGRTVGLVGESGSGKTTLAKIVMHAMRPDEGHVLFDDGEGGGAVDVASLEGEALMRYRRAVQFVFQDPFSSLNPRMTVLDILTEPLAVHGVASGDEAFERVKALLEIVGLNVTHLRRYPHSFSGGQRQRIGLARALALSPAVILCDEPTSALDVSVQAQVLNLLKDLQRQLGVSYLFVTHNLAVIDYMADSIAVMCRGHVVEEAPREALFRNPRHPYTRALLAAVPSADLDHPLDFAAIAKSGVSDPASWPEPFTIRPGGTRPAMVEVEPLHFVRVGAAENAACALAKAS